MSPSFPKRAILYRSSIWNRYTAAVNAYVAHADPLDVSDKVLEAIGVVRVELSKNQAYVGQPLACDVAAFILGRSGFDTSDWTQEHVQSFYAEWARQGYK